MKKSEITKQKILKAAEAAFAEKGFYGARVDEITENAGVNKRMIYAYFGSKENLYITVLDNVYQRLATSEEELLSEESDPIDAVKRLIRHDFEFLAGNASFVKMVMWENLNEAKYMKQSDAVPIKRTAMKFLRKKLNEGMEQGIFRADLDVEETILFINLFCFACFSNIHTMSHIMGVDFSGDNEIKKHCAYVMDVILKAITADGSGENAADDFPRLAAFAQNNNGALEKLEYTVDFVRKEAK